MSTLIGRTAQSKSSRSRKRGETEEAWRKRCAALDAHAARTRAYRERKAEAPAKSPTKSIENERGGVRDVAERTLIAASDEAKLAERAVLELQVRLERERAEKAQLEEQVRLRGVFLAERHRVELEQKRLSSSKLHQGVEIVELSGGGDEKEAAREIIEKFGDRDEPSKTPVTSERKLLILEELSAERDGDGRNPKGEPPLGGFSLGAAFAIEIDTDVEVQKTGGTNQTPQPPERPKLDLLAASELILWIGWLDRTRAALGARPLSVRFSRWERRIWREVVEACCAAVGSADLSASSSDVPFAYELAWTLRWSLRSLPPGVAIPELAWRCVSSFLRPQPRGDLGVLAGLDRVETIMERYSRVQRELDAGTLVIDRGEL